MAGAFLYLVLGRYSEPRAVLLVICLVYIAISLFALAGKRWAIVMCIMVALLLTIRWVPMVAINAWMFATGHELYRDSPATILVVLSYAIVFAIPSLILCVLYFFQRKHIWKILKK